MYHTVMTRTPGRTADACCLHPPVGAALAAERREGTVAAAPLAATWMLMSAALSGGPKRSRSLATSYIGVRLSRLSSFKDSIIFNRSSGPLGIILGFARHAGRAA